MKSFFVKYKKSAEKKSGFISIFAIFFSAIILSVLTALYILLLKQIELMSYESSSFQALYVADSLFECVVYKEQNTPNNSVFIPTNSTLLGNCGTNGDLVWSQSPSVTGGRANSIAHFTLNTVYGDFCGVAKVNKETRITAFFTSAPDPDSATISGQSRPCTDNTTKAVERVVEFYY
jgi:hypothetical protein